MVLGEGESVPYRGVPYFGEGVWLIEGFHCTYRKIKKRKHTCVVTCTCKDPMNMYVNEIQMSNIRVCLSGLQCIYMYMLYFTYTCPLISSASLVKTTSSLPLLLPA